MNEEDLRAQIKDEILSTIRFETLKNASLVTAICVTVIVDDASTKPPAQAVCRFYLQNGTFIGEVPAKNIINHQAKLTQEF